MKIAVCVGSSCHIKGSYQIIELMKNALAEHGLRDKVELRAAFCLGKCANGVSIQVDDEVICGVCPENFEDIFHDYVMNRPEVK